MLSQKKREGDAEKEKRKSFFFLLLLCGQYRKTAIPRKRLANETAAQLLIHQGMTHGLPRASPPTPSPTPKRLLRLIIRNL